MPAEPPAPALPRVLGPWMAAAVVVGTVIGSGVFKKAKVVSESVPESGAALMIWVLVGALSAMGALAYAEVAVRVPRAGGNYAYLRAGLGPWAGFLWGWVEFTMIRSASIAVLATMATEALHGALRQVVLPPGDPREVLAFWPRQAITVGLITALTVVNSRGTRLGGKVQVFLTVLKLASLAALVVLPVVIYTLNPSDPKAPGVSRMAPVWPAGWGGLEQLSKIGTAFVGVYWAYQGWMNIGPIASEVRDPQRNVPRAVLGGIAVLAAIYVAVNASYYTVLTAQEMAALSGTPVATEFCLRLLGPVGAVVASLALMVSVTGSLNGNILVAPRLLYAMAEDGLAPKRLQDLHPVYRTPRKAMIVYSGWSVLLVLGLGALTVYRLPPFTVGGLTVDPNLTPGKDPFDVLTDYAMFGALVFETLAVLSLFWLRRRPAESDVAYRCPGYPVVPAVYVLVMSAVAANMIVSPAQRGEAVIGLAFMAVGAVVYGVIRRPFGERPV